MASNDVERRAARRGRASVAGAFAAHALLSGLLGPWIPTLQERSGLDPGGLGMALTGFAAGLLMGTRLAAPVVRAAGCRRVVLVGIPVLGAGFATLPLADGLASLAIVLSGVGLVAGLLDVAMNAEAIAVERNTGRRVMAAIHGTWSVALFGGATIASVGVGLATPIGIHLPVVAAAIVLVSLPVLRWLPAHDPVADQAGDPASVVGDDEERRNVVLLCLVAGSSFLVEGIAVEWSGIYLRGELDAGPALTGLGVVAFSAGMALSRFVGDRVAARVGQPAVIRAGTAAACAALLVVVLLDRAVPSIAAFGIVGLGLGPVVPLAFRSAGAALRRSGRSALPIVVTAGYTGSIVGPAVTGFLAEAVGLRAAFLVPVGACAVATAFAAAAADVADVTRSSPPRRSPSRRAPA